MNGGLVMHRLVLLEGGPELHLDVEIVVIGGRHRLVGRDGD